MSNEEYSSIHHLEEGEDTKRYSMYTVGEPEEMAPKFEVPDIEIICVNIEADKEGNIWEVLDQFGGSTAIQQVSKLLGYEMNLKEEFLAANTEGGRAAIIELAQKYHLTKEETAQAIEEVEQLQGAVVQAAFCEAALPENVTFVQLNEVMQKEIHPENNPEYFINGYMKRNLIGYEPTWKEDANAIVLSEIQFCFSDPEHPSFGYEIGLPTFHRFQYAKEIAECLNNEPQVHDNYHVDAIQIFNGGGVIVLQPVGDFEPIPMVDMDEIISKVIDERGFLETTIEWNPYDSTTRLDEVGEDIVRWDEYHTNADEYQFTGYSIPIMGGEQNIGSQKDFLHSILSELHLDVEPEMHTIFFEDVEYNEQMIEGSLEPMDMDADDLEDEEPEQ